MKNYIKIKESVLVKIAKLDNLVVFNILEFLNVTYLPINQIEKLYCQPFEDWICSGW